MISSILYDTPFVIVGTKYIRRSDIIILIFCSGVICGVSTNCLGNEIGSGRISVLEKKSA